MWKVQCEKLTKTVTCSANDLVVERRVSNWRCRCRAAQRYSANYICRNRYIPLQHVPFVERSFEKTILTHNQVGLISGAQVQSTASWTCNRLVFGSIRTLSSHNLLRFYMSIDIPSAATCCIGRSISPSVPCFASRIYQQRPEPKF